MAACVSRNTSTATSRASRQLLETRHDDFGDNDGQAAATKTRGLHDRHVCRPEVSGRTSIIQPSATPMAEHAQGLVRGRWPDEFNQVDKADKLHVEDLGLHMNSNATLGVGWEGRHNTSPLLYTELPAQIRFRRRRQDRRTNGGAVVLGGLDRSGGGSAGRPRRRRRANSYPAENFVTAGRFARMPPIGNNATLLLQEHGQRCRWR